MGRKFHHTNYRYEKFMFLALYSMPFPIPRSGISTVYGNVSFASPSHVTFYVKFIRASWLFQEDGQDR